MKLRTYILSEVLQRNISIFFWPNQPKKNLKEIFPHAKNLTFINGYSINALRYHRDFLLVGPMYIMLLRCTALAVVPLPTHSVAGPNTFQIFVQK